jgi:Domain of unknown function (DUF4232)
MSSLTTLRRAVAVASAVFVLAACSSSDDAAGPSATASEPVATSTAVTTSLPPDTSTTSPTSTTRPGGEPCATASLALASGEGRAAVGHALHVFTLRNTSRQPCRMTGFPAVALLDGQGRVVVEARRGGGYILTDKPPKDVSLAPGASAWFGVESSTLCADDAPPTPTERVRVAPPGESGTGALVVAAMIDVCADQAVLVSPVRATERELAQ